MKILLIILLIPLNILAQLSLKLDTNSILIGNQVKLNIQVELKDATLPIFKDSIGQLEILYQSKIDSLKTEKGWLIKQSYYLTAWDSGTYHIPAITIGPYTSDSIKLVVQTIDLGQNSQLKDIKEPLNTPIGLEESLPYIIAFIILVLIIFLTLKYLKKRKEKLNIAIPVEEKIPPYEIALKELELLNSKKLWQNGNVKQYYTILSEIIRTYIENGIGTPAMEIPTNDIIHQLQQKGIDTIELKELLCRADLAKFAKAQPLEIENQNSFQIAKQFVDKTKVIDQNDVE